ncbi:MAG: Tol-Pal system beta propeller repeat protein TolB [Wenzhouxiangellaceae bacterium]
MKQLFATIAALMLIGGLWSPAQAKLEIEITQGVASAMPIAIVPFAWQVPDEVEPVDSVTDVIASDLYRSGLFDPMAESDMIERPTAPEDVRFGTWRLLKVDAVVVGQVRAVTGGYELEYHLIDVFSGRQLLSQVQFAAAGDLRFGAHRVADTIYQALTGQPGAFATRIAYIVATGEGDDSRYELVVADSDGFNEQSIVSSPQPLLSPAWSPDGRQLAYVSFARGNSTIMLQNIFSGEREQIAAFKGINGAPAFSPDGRRLALTLSRSGSPEIYLFDLASREFTQLTSHWGIDTEATWSPDGRHLYFTSDRGGRPQIYRIAVGGGDPERITFQGEYNARASLSPDGRYIATTHGNDNDYRIAVYDRETEQLRVLSSGRLDESPSFAPNGSMILYATRESGRGVLAAVSADGNVRQKLVQSLGDVREPAWSPLVR